MRGRRAFGILLAGLVAVMGALAGCGAPTTPELPVGAVSSSATTRSTIPTILVTAAHVKDNLARSIVIDARSVADYTAGHIAGAINARWQRFSNAETGKPGDAGWGTLRTASEIAADLGSLGVQKDKQIVVYTSPDNWGADGRIVWTLRVAGFPNSMILDGGYKTWTDAGYPTSTDPTTLTPVTVSVGSLDQSMRITTAELAAHLGDSKLIDVRTEKEFAGSTDSGEVRGGHLPGAANVPFASMFKDDGTLKSASDIFALMETAGVSMSDDIVFYSTDGVRSAYATLVFRAMGYTKVRNYDGSFYEWAGDASLKLVP